MALAVSQEIRFPQITAAPTAKSWLRSTRSARKVLQHEDLRLDLPTITHLSLTIVPNKGGSGVATLTSLRIFAQAAS